MGASSSHSSSQPVDMTPQSFKDLQQPFASVLNNLLGQYTSQMGSNLLGGYSGPTTTPITGTEQQDLQQLQGASQQIGANPSSTGSTTQDQTLNQIQQAGGNNAATTASQLMGANQNPTTQQSANDYLANLNGASNGAFSNDPNNPTLNAAITAAQRQTQQALDQTLTRDLPGQFIQAGQIVRGKGSSAFDRAAALAYGQGANALADISTNMQYSNLNDANNRAASALGQYTTGQQNANAQTQQLTAEQQQNANTNAINAAQQQTNGMQANSNISAQNINSMIANLNAQALPRLIQDLGVERGMEVYNNNINSILAGLGIVSVTTRPVVSNSSSSSSGGVQLK